MAQTISDCAVNDFAVFRGSEDLVFATVGFETIRLWKIDEESEDLLVLDVPCEKANFTSVASTGKLSAPYNCSQLLIIGTETGDVILYDPERENDGFLAKIEGVCKSQIGMIHTTETSIILGDIMGSIIRQPITPDAYFFEEQGTYLQLEAPAVAFSFEATGKEGVIGTMNSEIRYINWNEGANIRLGASHIGKSIDGASFDKASFPNPLFLTGGENGVVKLWTSKTGDKLFGLSPTYQPINGIFSHPKARIAAILSEDGYIHFFSFKRLSLIGRVHLNDKIPTYASFAVTGEALIVGTSSESIFQITSDDWEHLSNMRVSVFTEIEGIV